MDDLISREEAIDAITRKMVSIPTAGEKDLMGDVNRIRAEDISVIRRLPSAQPEMNLDEWCTDCKEYDHERHCCPRWNRVIRTTLKDVPEIIRCKDCKYSDTDNTLGVMFCCRISYHEASEDGFCSWAERRTDAD